MNCLNNKHFRRLYCLITTAGVCVIILHLSYTYRIKSVTSVNAKKNIIAGVVETAAAPSRLVSNGEACDAMCSTRECVIASNHLLGTMVESADPCEDSYAMACGQIERFRPEDDLLKVDAMHYQLFANTKEVLENIDASPSSPAGKLKTVYDSCVSENSSEFNAVMSLSNYLKRFGIRDWPNLEKDFQFNSPSIWEAFSIFISHGQMLQYYDMPLLIITPQYQSQRENRTSSNSSELDNSEKYKDNMNVTDSLKMLRVSRGGMLDIDKDVKAKITRMAHYLGASSEIVAEIMEDLDNFNTVAGMIAEISNKKEDEKVDHLEENGEFNCTEGVGDDLVYICDIIGHFIKYNKLEKEYSKTVFEGHDVSYLRTIHTFLTRASHRSLANYAAVQFLTGVASNLDVFFKISSRVPLNRLTKWKYCVEWTINSMKPLIRKEYSKKVLDRDMNEIHKIIDFYIGIAAYIIKKENWIEETIRRNISERIQSHINELQEEIAILENSPTVDLIYEKFEPSKDNFFQNVMELRNHYLRQNLLHPHILQHGDIFSLGNPFMVNAANSMRIGLEMMFGILLPPVYESGRPKIMNFASLGDIVGHETGHEIHGFYFIGDNYIADNETKDAFKKKEMCLEEQYSNFEDKGSGIKVNGSLTLIENMADLIGQQLSEKMVEMFLEEQGEGGKFALPALDYTYQQLILLSSSQLWCSKPTKEELKHLSKDVHAFKPIRQLGKAMNSRKYSEAFQCELGRRMNPVHKCSFFESI